MVRPTCIYHTGLCILDICNEYILMWFSINQKYCKYASVHVRVPNHIQIVNRKVWSIYLWFFTVFNIVSWGKFRNQIKGAVLLYRPAICHCQRLLHLWTSQSRIWYNYWTRLSKISWFISGEQINYLPVPKAEENNWSVSHW